MNQRHKMGVLLLQFFLLLMSLKSGNAEVHGSDETTEGEPMERTDTQWVGKINWDYGWVISTGIGPLAMHGGECRRKLMEMSRNPILIGQTVPQCDNDGNYNARQCSGSIGSCWCVDKVTGKEIKYLHVDNNGLPLCEPNCFLELKKGPAILQHGVPVLVANYVPSCDLATGYFLPKQCLKDKSQCWCVSKLGKEIKNSRSTDNVSCKT